MHARAHGARQSERDERQLDAGDDIRVVRVPGKSRRAARPDHGPARRLEGGRDGTPEVLEDAELSELGLVTDSWPLRDGNVALTFWHTEVVDEGRNREFHRYDRLVVVDGSLQLTQEPLRLDAEDTDAVVVNEAPHFLQSKAGHDGERVVLLRGLEADRPFTEQFWLNHVTRDGQVRFAPPGINVTVVDGPTWEYGERDAFALSAWRQAVAWSHWTPDGVTGQVQLVDVDGVLVGPPRAYRPGDDTFEGTWTTDGAGNGYHFVSMDRPVGERIERPPRPGRPVGDPYERGSRFGVERYDEELESVWGGPLFVQDCLQRYREGNAALVGAHDEGVWLVWQESQPEPANGEYITITKVTLIRPDGTFAWGSP